jgi:hypothetical protein
MTVKYKNRWQHTKLAFSTFIYNAKIYRCLPEPRKSIAIYLCVAYIYSGTVKPLFTNVLMEWQTSRCFYSDTESFTTHTHFRTQYRMFAFHIAIEAGFQNVYNVSRTAYSFARGDNNEG